jgi:catechol 2,3-dioxygenase-like lactoylglutathione lyase family enzyme
VIVGFHHVRLPVSDAWRSRDWYMDVLGFIPLMDVTEEASLVGVVLRHPQGLIVGLHQDNARARALRGFSVLGLAVAGRGQLERLASRLDETGVAHGPLTEGHTGWYMDVPDPDGIPVRLHSEQAPYSEEA